MAKKPPKDIPIEKVELYEALLATNPEIVRKGANNPYTSLNGHMYTFLGKDGRVALRMSKTDREAFLQKYNTELAVSYNTVMKEYVSVPDDLLPRIEELKPYLQMSYDYVSSLKPKPTTKTKKK